MTSICTAITMTDEPEIEYIDDEDELNAASDCFDEWLDEQEFLDSDE